MGWFGGGSDDKGATSEKGFLSDDAGAFEASGDMLPGVGGGGGLSELQEFGNSMQQQLIVHQAITEISQRAFQKCITSAKDGKLSGKEVACIHAVTNKWIDSNEYMVGRLARKQQQASSSQF